MSRLLKSDFKRLFQASYFYLTIMVSALIGFLITLLLEKTPKEDINIPPGMEDMLGNMMGIRVEPSFGSIIIPFAAAVIVGMFLEAEFTQGAIRNKIICGHNRNHIFFASLLTLIVGVFCCFAVCELAIIGSSVFIFGNDSPALDAALYSTGIMFLMITAMSTILSFTIGSFFHGGKLIAILLAVQYVMEISIFFAMYSNRSKILEYLSRVFPQSSIFQFNYFERPDKLWINALISAVAALIFIIFGLLKFRKCDIR